MNLLGTLVIVILVSGDGPTDLPVSEVRSRQAVVGGLEYLRHEGVKWMQEKQCASCHHSPFTLWAMNEARGQGFQVDEAALAEITAWSLATDNRAKLIAAEGTPNSEGLSVGAVYTVLGVRAGRGDAAPEGLDRFESHIVSRQQADGSWKSPEGRAPLFEGQEALTLLSILALEPRAGATGPAADASAAGREKAIAWLASTPSGGSHQASALRLLVLSRLNRPAAEIESAALGLIARQEADGGWRQTPEMASDALATGQSLYALRLSGLNAHAPAIEKGVQFLVETQRADGSWAMQSRPTKPGASGASNLGPITYVGTSWATIGLVRAAPAK